MDAPDPPRTDDELRRYAAEQLAEHLAIGVSMATRCQGLSMQANLDKVGPLNAAARLMQANARVVEALATFALIERRKRSISERIQSPDKKQAELNSKLEEEKRLRQNVTEFWQRMRDLTESKRTTHGEEDAYLATRLAAEKAKLAYVERKLAGKDSPGDIFGDEDENDA
jgi:hypothetical protein